MLTDPAEDQNSDVEQKHTLTCQICGALLSGRRTRFCGRRCKNRNTNYHHQSYVRQLERSRRNKIRLIALKGGRCHRCGYSANLAALEFHHRDSETKAFELDARSLANRAWDQIVVEAQKCDLVCSNCHAEIHHPGGIFDPAHIDHNL